MDAYNKALARLHQGDKPRVRRQSNAADLRRFFTPATVGFEGDGTLTIQSQPEQETSSFLMYQSLERLPPKAKELLISLMDTGDLQASADAVGLSKSEVEQWLPLLRKFLRPDEERAEPLAA
jgi:hypothetical protein